jgi:Rrf2 family nitric oxide-sensitive transcriptional repressor
VPAECFASEESACAIARCCSLRGVLGEAVGAFYAVLDRYTLADITRNRQALASILHVHKTLASER